MFYLIDGNGYQWAVNVTDAGLLQTTKGSLGSAPNVYLNDPSNGTSWQLGVTNAGLLQATSVTLNTSYPQSIVILSTPSSLNWALLVTSVGILQTELFTVDEDPYFARPQREDVWEVTVF